MIGFPSANYRVNTGFFAVGKELAATGVYDDLVSLACTTRNPEDCDQTVINDYFSTRQFRYRSLPFGFNHRLLRWCKIWQRTFHTENVFLLHYTGAKPWLYACEESFRFDGEFFVLWRTQLIRLIGSLSGWRREFLIEEVRKTAVSLWDSGDRGF
jgi:hypothetical protein